VAGAIGGGPEWRRLACVYSHHSGGGARGGCIVNTNRSATLLAIRLTASVVGHHADAAQADIRVLCPWHLLIPSRCQFGESWRSASCNPCWSANGKEPRHGCRGSFVALAVSRRLRVSRVWNERLDGMTGRTSTKVAEEEDGSTLQWTRLRGAGRMRLRGYYEGELGLLKGAASSNMPRRGSSSE